MKRFSHCELTKELVLLFTFGVTILLLYSAVPDYYSALQVQAQVQQQQQQRLQKNQLSIGILKI